MRRSAMWRDVTCTKCAGTVRKPVLTGTLPTSVCFECWSSGLAVYMKHVFKVWIGGQVDSQPVKHAAAIAQGNTRFVRYVLASGQQGIMAWRYFEAEWRA